MGCKWVFTIKHKTDGTIYVDDMAVIVTLLIIYADIWLLQVMMLKKLRITSVFGIRG